MVGQRCFFGLTLGVENLIFLSLQMVFESDGKFMLQQIGLFGRIS